MRDVRGRRIFLATFLFAATNCFSSLWAQQAQEAGIVPPSFSSVAQAALYDKMAGRLIAPCCWAEPIRLHESPAAARARAELISYVKAGMGEGEIQARFAGEYGERILGQPRGMRNIVAYAVPAICCALGLLALSTFVKRRSQIHRPAAAGAALDLPEFPDFV